ncbi:MAG TPA: hypothetical protein VHN20_11790 [Beijerinckiaceae bacterium]|nr:hypothetical protein [Beijerinckiaceae bacterium]
MDYRRHAEECRALAKQMKMGEQRDQLLKMAETWETLASERQRTLRVGRQAGATPDDDEVGR